MAVCGTQRSCLHGSIMKLTLTFHTHCLFAYDDCTSCTAGLLIPLIDQKFRALGGCCVAAMWKAGHSENLNELSRKKGGKYNL